MTKVLVVDDEPPLLRAMVLNLSHRGYEVDTATTATAALAQIRRSPPDLLILDLGLPDLDGLHVIRELGRSEPMLPVIVLSARSTTSDKVTALDLGAVDYVSKPFDMNELVARLRAAVRRTGAAARVAPVTFGNVEVDLVARTAKHNNGSDIHLTPTEWRILDVLLRDSGRLVTGRELLTVVRGGPDHTDSSYLRIYLAQLRRKLEPVPSRPRHLITEPGMGYRFRP